MADIFKAMFIIVSSFINIFYMQATIYKYDIHNLEHTVVDSYMPKDRFKFQFHAVEQKKINHSNLPLPRIQFFINWHKIVIKN